MKLRDVDKEKMKDGEYCHKGMPGCFCKAGWPYEYMCADCRDHREYVRDGKVFYYDKIFCMCSHMNRRKK
jgi:hypothetical protein